MEDFQQQTDTVTPETAAPETVEQTDEQAPAPTVDDTMQKVMDKHYPHRSANGQFASKNPEAPESEAASEDITDQPNDEAATETVETPSIEAPHSWSADMKARFGEVPPEVQGYIAQREAEAHKAITQAGEQIKAFEPVAQVLGQHANAFSKYGLNPADGIQYLLNVNAELENGNATDVIQRLAQAYDVDLRQFSGEQQDSNEPSAPNAEVAMLRNELKQIRGILTNQQREQHDRAQLERDQSIQAEIQDFAKDKPYFEDVRALMGKLMAGQAANTMQEAYDQALKLHPDISVRIQQDQRRKTEEQQQQAAAKAKKAAAQNVKTKPGKAPSEARTPDDTMRAIMQKHGFSV